MRRGPSRAATLIFAILALVSASPTPDTEFPAAPVTRRELVETPRFRVGLVEMAAGADLPSHEHAVDHLLLTLTAGELVESVEGVEPRRLALAEGVLDFVPAGRRHALRNGRAEPFRGVTVDLLTPQSGARNRCLEVLPSRPLDCPAGPPANARLPHGVALAPLLSFDQTEITRLDLAPGARLGLPASSTPPVVVPFADSEALAFIEVRLPGGAGGRGERELRTGDAFALPPGMAVELHNPGSRVARFLVVDPLGD